MLIFTPDGRFAQIHIASDVPKIASGNRLTGTRGGIRRDQQAQPLGVRQLYGGRRQEDGDVQDRLDRTFPNWEGEAQTRTIDKLTADEFVNTNPNVAGGRGRRGELLQAQRK